MRGIAGSIFAFLIAMSLAGAVAQRGGRGAHEFDLGPAPEIARGQVRAVELQAAGGVRTAAPYPKFTAVYVTRTASGALAIFPNATPIAGCLLVWRAATATTPPAFVDPCAGGQWDVQGRYISGPERQDLFRLPAAVSDAGRLIIDTLDVSPGAPADAPPEATPEGTPPPSAPAPATEPAWVLVPTVATPPRSEGSWVAGTLVNLGREWGVTAADAAILLVALALVVGSVGYGSFAVVRTRARPLAGDAAVYLEWRNGRRWSRYPDPDIILASGDEREVRVRLINEGRRAARGVSVVLDAERPLTIDLDARSGSVARSVLPDAIHLAWEFQRTLPPHGRSPVERMRLRRSTDTDVTGLTSVLAVRCTPVDGGHETTTHVAVRLS